MNLSRAEKVQLMHDVGVVAVVRAPSSEALVDVSKALAAGGVNIIEITMTTPNALKVIEQVAAKMGDDVLVGVGSVLDPETARAAILAGAEFVVGPCLNLAMVSVAKRYGLPVVPGAFSPTEILTAWTAGADVVKVFPATKLGPRFFKDVKGPMPFLKLTPTGGVNLETTPEFIQAGAEFVGVGSALVRKDLVAKKDFAALTDLATQYVDVVKKARAS
jgi:2-dehydro-3-deoxyphosphogluconate aldolase/(4S)-4-hydroxy-2-oxoglutarate aldolase